MFRPPEKISGIFEEVEIMSCCTLFCKESCSCYRENYIHAIFFIMGDVCKLMTKSLNRLIECRGGWDAQLVLDADVLLELKYWGEHLRSLNCRPIWKETVTAFSHCLFRR